MFNIPLASPFCIFYRTGLPPNPSSLNASNIRTLLAHRFHLLKLLVIINYIFIFVKRTLSFIILKPFPLTHVKTFSFPSFCTYTDFNTSWSNIFRSLFSNCKSFNFNLTSYKNLNTIHMSHHIYLQYHLEFFCELRARSPVETAILSKPR